MSGAGTDPIPISALQHAVYCLRQAALIHLERLWAENRFTAEGELLHVVADKGGTRSGRGARRVHALPLASVRLNLVGIADLVEFSRSAPEAPEVAFPIEYKRGKPKSHLANEVQLCAQGLCLEEMTGLPVPEGALFYAETRRRVTVPFDADLRALTESTVANLDSVLASGVTPLPTLHRSRCRACSLAVLCCPDTVARPVRTWRRRQVEAAITA